MKDPQTWLYPPIDPFNSGYFSVGKIHQIYFEESGNPQGKPVIFLHGGPGGGTNPRMRRYFNPLKYRIILIDQRGAGRSTPSGCLEENTTWDLVSDLEVLRNKLGIKAWQVFGGSWGSTLALAYSETHPDRVTEVILRGIFLVRPQEIKWFYQEGANAIFPDLWEPYRDHIPEKERNDFVSAYYKRLTSDDKDTILAAARIWSVWEASTSKLLIDSELVQTFSDASFAYRFARIEAHYFMNQCFLKQDQLLKDVHKIRHIPGVIVQGRYDIVCPSQSAWDLHRAWPEADFIWAPDAGHAVSEPSISKALVAATDRFAD